jgi:magnesium transporter
MNTKKHQEQLVNKKRRKKVGLPPGTPVYVGAETASPPIITLTRYTESETEELPYTTREALASFQAQPGVHWINIEGVHQPELIQEIGTHFNLHPLTLEDIVNTDQRPKREDMEHYLYVVLKMISLSPEKSLVTEQVSLIITKDTLISFQEMQQRGDVFDHVRERIRQNRGKIRRSGPDYLLHALLDAVVDHYFIILEELGEQVESLEHELINAPGPELLSKLYGLKRQMLSLRRSIWPLREVLGGMQREDSSLLSPTTEVYLQDVYSHTVQIIDTIEILRETLSSMLDIYLSSVSNRMNSVMKILTVVATIFMPLTFIAGVYGMNFKYMPELESVYGYPAALGLMAIVAIGMLVSFRRKGWI